MKTIRKPVSSEITEKRSKFIGNLCYVETVEEAEAKIEEIRKKYHDAKHNCFAYRILDNKQVIERASDDGEPSGTAGAPMLELLKKQDLVNVLIVVTRYFGGILLGTGGLVRAYTKVSNDAIDKSELAILTLGQVLKVPVSYQNLAFLQYYCGKNSIKILEINFEREPYAIVEIDINEKDKFLHEIKEKQFSIQKIEIVEEKYLQKNIE